MARILIVAGGCRGRQLAAELAGEGHAVRITTRRESARPAIEATGAECFIGTPDRLATLRAALENVTILCWLLGSASGTPEELSALHSTRVQYFLTQAIDTTVRGVVYEATATSPAATALIAEGERLARTLLVRNAMPAAFLTADPADTAAWLAQARAAIASLMSGG